MELVNVLEIVTTARCHSLPTNILETLIFVLLFYSNLLIYLICSQIILKTSVIRIGHFWWLAKNGPQRE